MIRGKKLKNLSEDNIIGLESLQPEFLSKIEDLFGFHVFFEEFDVLKFLMGKREIYFDMIYDFLAVGERSELAWDLKEFFDRK